MAGLQVASLFGTLDLQDTFTDKLSQAEKKAQGFGKTLDSTESMAKSFGAALGALPIAGLFVDAIKQASEYEDSVTQLDAALKSTAATTAKAADTQGHWGTTVSLSGKEQSKLSKEIDSANKALDNQITRADLMGKTTKSAAVSMEMTRDKIAGLTAELTKGTTPQKAWVNGQAAIAQTTHMSEQALLDLASTLAKTTKYSEETTISSEALLLTFTQIGSDTFPRAQKAILDVSTAMKQDLKESTVQVGKALNDPIQGITALHRVGVEFSDSQKAMIKNFVNTNQLAKAQGVILDELNREFGGSAEAAGTTFSGKMAILQNSFNDFLKVAGQQAIPVLGAIASIIAVVTGALQNADPAFVQIGMAIGAVSLLFSPMAAGLLAMLGPMALVVGAAAALGLAWTNNWGGIRTTVEGVIASVTPQIETFGKIAKAAWDALNPGAMPTVQQDNRAIKSDGNAIARRTPQRDQGQNSDFATAFQKNLDKLKIPADISGGLVNLAKWLQDIGPGGDAAALAIGALGVALVQAALGTAFGAITSTIGGVITGLGGMALAGFGAVLPILLLGAAIAILIEAVTHFSDLEAIFGPGGPLSQLGDAVRKAAQDILTPFVDLAYNIGKAFMDPLINIVTAITMLPTIFGKVATDIKAKFQPVIDVMNAALEAAVKLTTGVDVKITPGATFTPGSGAIGGGTPSSSGAIGQPSGNLSAVPAGTKAPEIKPTVIPPTTTDYDTALAPFIQIAKQYKAPPIDINTPTQANVSGTSTFLQTTGSAQLGAATNLMLTGAGTAAVGNTAIQTTTTNSFGAAITWVKGEGASAAAGATSAMVGKMGGIMAGAGDPLVEAVRSALLEIANMFGGLPNNVGGQVAAQVKAAAMRANGGEVTGGGLYQVGEGNRPEMLRMGGKQYLIPGDNGSVISNRDLMRNPDSNRSVIAGSTRGNSGGGDLHIHGLVINGVQNPNDLWNQLQSVAKTKNMVLGAAR